MLVGEELVGGKFDFWNYRGNFSNFLIVVTCLELLVENFLF